MNGKEFVDTNILIYAFDRTAGKKRETAAALVERLWTERAGCVSLQLLQEFYVTATKKAGRLAFASITAIDVPHRVDEQIRSLGLRLQRSGNLGLTRHGLRYRMDLRERCVVE